MLPTAAVKYLERAPPPQAGCWQLAAKTAPSLPQTYGYNSLLVCSVSILTTDEGTETPTAAGDCWLKYTNGSYVSQPVKEPKSLFRGKGRVGFQQAFCAQVAALSYFVIPTIFCIYFGFDHGGSGGCAFSYFIFSLSLSLYTERPEFEFNTGR